MPIVFKIGRIQLHQLPSGTEKWQIDCTLEIFIEQKKKCQKNAEFIQSEYYGDKLLPHVLSTRRRIPSVNRTKILIELCTFVRSIRLIKC